MHDTRIIELRQYTMRPGRRDALIELFEREFIETQEACGIRVIGQFRDLDRPDRFVWLRGYPDLGTRREALTAFYDGPVWLRHRDAANATMLDSDDVLILQPAHPGSGFAPSTGRGAHGLIAASVYALAVPPAEFAGWFDRHAAPRLSATGAAVIARLVTEPSPNNFPRHPVREGESVFAVFMRFADAGRHDAHRAALARDALWQQEIAPRLREFTQGEPQRLRLAPSARSALHG